MYIYTQVDISNADQDYSLWALYPGSGEVSVKVDGAYPDPRLRFCFLVHVLLLIVEDCLCKKLFLIVLTISIRLYIILYNQLLLFFISSVTRIFGTRILATAAATGVLYIIIHSKYCIYLLETTNRYFKFGQDNQNRYGAHTRGSWLNQYSGILLS